MPSQQAVIGEKRSQTARASHIAVRVRRDSATHTNTSDGRTPRRIEELATVFKDQIMALSACDVQKIVVEITMEYSRFLDCIRFAKAIDLGSLHGTGELRHCKEEGDAAYGKEDGRRLKMRDVSLDIESTRPNSPQPTLIIL